MSSLLPREHGLAPHRRLGRYVVQERLAHGGMGEVWRASVDGPGGFRKQVVLKTVRADLAARRSLVDMLIREAALAARLSHPNIVTVFDLDCVDGVYFFAMEYVPGHTLAELLRQAEERGSALPPWFVASVLASCCDGLQYAHDLADERGTALGLVHRDISLNNVMVAATGNVTLLDFGIATASVTGIGTREGRDLLMGKFQYMPPEVVRGLPSDRRCDIYGLGVVALIATSGAMPYRARDDADLLQQIVAGPPRDLARRCGRLPLELARAILRAMDHDPERRYPEAALLGADLREFLHRTGSPAPTADDLARYVIDLFTPETAPIELASGTDSGPSIRIDVDESAILPPPPPVPMASAPTPTPPVREARDAHEPIDVFTTSRPRPAGVGVFDGWSSRAESSSEDLPPPTRWPWR
jgi:eukaryotic-like serine/threonine-protein kinase